MDNINIKNYLGFLKKMNCYMPNDTEILNNTKDIQQEKYVKPNKNLHFSTSNLYYYVDSNQDTSFEKTNETITANINLFKQDLLEDLDATDKLYDVNDDGSYSISKSKINI
jgi:flagellar biosynthesis regulator FlbT